MRKHIVCLGDSNTHGYCADPSDCGDSGLRFNEDERWTRLLQKALGEEYLVVEEGLSGRTAVFRDPLNEGMSALDYLYPCLKSHEPVSLLVIMLGTNDTKERFGASAAVIANGMKRLVLKAQSIDCWGGRAPNILIVSPPSLTRRWSRPMWFPTWATDAPQNHRGWRGTTGRLPPSPVFTSLTRRAVSLTRWISCTSQKKVTENWRKNFRNWCQSWRNKCAKAQKRRKTKIGKKRRIVSFDLLI